MRITEATEDDVGEVLALIEELAAYEEMSEHVICTTAGLRQALFGPDPVARVNLAVDDDGTIAGMALWFPTFSTFLGLAGIWLEDLFVRERYRSQGFGRALMEYLRAQTAGRVEWEVLDWNRPAIGFYEGLGARPTEGWTKYRWA